MHSATIDHFALRTTGAPGKEIVFRRRRPRRDEATPLPPIVDTISARLARRFAEAIGRGESVRWTWTISIDKDGLTFTARTLTEEGYVGTFRPEPPLRVHWDDIEKIEIDEGLCQFRFRDRSETSLAQKRLQWGHDPKDVEDGRHPNLVESQQARDRLARGRPFDDDAEPLSAAWQSARACVRDHLRIARGHRLG